MPIESTLASLLPPEIMVLERGWLSANNIVFVTDETTVVDTGYVTHSRQTVALIDAALSGRPLIKLINTHLHSDHCGGNAALQDHYPQVQSWIPPGQAEFVRNWDPVGLTYKPTGQQCPPFRFDNLLLPGSSIQCGSLMWQVHAAAGHDPHSVILFQPEHGILISADALWERGFGVVFPELDGLEAFSEVAATLNLIEQLSPRIVIPGHGKVFTEVTPALDYARKRLDGFMREPLNHARHGAKVLVKFKLLELQRAALAQLLDWACHTPQMMNLYIRHFAEQHDSIYGWVSEITKDLLRSGAAVMEGKDIINK